MFELVRTNDAVMISWITAELKARNIEILVLDENMSILDGSISAIPRRIMVDDADQDEAKQVLAEADRLAAQSD